MNKKYNHTRNPRAIWNKYKLMWNEKGNYSINEEKVKSKIPQKQLVFKTLSKILENPRLDVVLKFRQDWVVLDKKGKTDVLLTKQKVKDGLIGLKAVLEDDGFDGQFLDPYIENGLEELEPPPQPKLKKISKRKQKYLKDLRTLGLKQKTEI